MDFTTWLSIIREQQVEIKRNRVIARLKDLLIRYLQKDPSRLENFVEVGCN
jgi:hypothetical protein